MGIHLVVSGSFFPRCTKLHQCRQIAVSSSFSSIVSIERPLSLSFSLVLLPSFEQVFQDSGFQSVAATKRATNRIQTKDLRANTKELRKRCDTHAPEGLTDKVADALWLQASL